MVRTYDLPIDGSDAKLILDDVACAALSSSTFSVAAASPPLATASSKASAKAANEKRSA